MCADLVEVAVQPVVNNGVKILQAAPVKRIEDVSARPGLLEPGIHLIGVLQLKQEIWHRSRTLLRSRQVKKVCELESKTNIVSKDAPKTRRFAQVCVWQRTSSFCSVFTAKLFEKRIQCARAR